MAFPKSSMNTQVRLESPPRHEHTQFVFTPASNAGLLMHHLCACYRNAGQLRLHSGREESRRSPLRHRRLFHHSCPPPLLQTSHTHWKFNGTFIVSCLRDFSYNNSDDDDDGGDDDNDDDGDNDKGDDAWQLPKTAAAEETYD